MKPSIGRIVHYVLTDYEPDRTPVLRCKAAIVTDVLNAETGTVSLMYFEIAAMPAPMVRYSETPEDRTWHWPEEGEGG